MPRTANSTNKSRAERARTDRIISDLYSQNAMQGLSLRAQAERVIEELQKEHFPKRETSGIEARIRFLSLSLPRPISAVRSSQPVSPTSDLEPWNPRWNHEQGIPDDAMPDLLGVWRWATVTGMTFTYRQALWVSRLRGCLPPPRAPSELWDWATQFAFRGDADYSDLLAALAGMTAWERRTAEEVQAIKRRTPLVDLLAETRGMGLDDSPAFVAEEALGVFSGFSRPEIRRSMPVLKGEAERVYALWLRHLGHGPRWRTLSHEERLRIAIRLREWVQAADQPTVADSPDEGRPAIFQKPRGWGGPVSLPEEVGYPG